MNKTTPDLFEGIRQLYQEISVLGLAGFAGAIFEAITNPEKNWFRRAALGFSGVLSAVFLGGAVAYMIDQSIGGGVWIYSAVGFLAGRGGEMFIKRVQNKIFGDEDANRK